MAEAERMLEKIRSEMAMKTTWSKGYLNALEGMLIALKSGDSKYAYLNRLDPENHTSIEKARRRFKEEANNPLEDEFDKGFFAAWDDYLLFLKAMKHHKDFTILDLFAERKT
jgi:hypothetical protein